MPKFQKSLQATFLARRPCSIVDGEVKYSAGCEYLINPAGSTSDNDVKWVPEVVVKSEMPDELKRWEYDNAPPERCHGLEVAAVADPSKFCSSISQGACSQYGGDLAICKTYFDSRHTGDPELCKRRSCRVAVHQGCYCGGVGDKIWAAILKKSAAKVWQCDECKQCTVCNNDSNADQMCFCEECDAGMHTYCCSPPLTAVPEGEWRCPECAKGT